MPRFRLRYQSTDLEMPVGEFVVGRSSACHLALDDALVSRRHAVFHISPKGVEVEDLASRNGVLVNGEQVESRRKLQHLDRVVIGAQELLLVEVTSDEDQVRSRQTLAGLTLDLPALGDVDDETTHHSESILDTLVEKSLALGRFEEAERMLKRRLDAVLNEAKKSGGEIDSEKLAIVTSNAIRLADGLSKGVWLDWLFELYNACGKLMDADTINTLHEVVRRVRYRGGETFQRYLRKMQGESKRFGPNQQFLLQRLEGLKRVIGA